MIADYPHAPGDHCGSTSLRNLADYYGWGLEEAGCFGIGAGIGFEYDELGPTSRIILGRNAHLETNFFENLGISVVQQEGGSRPSAWDGLETQLESGPVLCYVDLYYLPYFGSDTHFGPHTVVVIDVTDDSVTISDSEFPELQTVSRQAFDDAWRSDYGFWPLDRWWLTVDTPELTVPTDTATRQAIESAARTMLDGRQDERSGVAAIRAFADDLPQWTAFDDVQWTARFAYQNIERRGTGGGAFRRLYGTFLETLGTNAGLDDHFGERMRRIADDWSELGSVLRDVSETDDTAEHATLLEDASDRAAALAAREEELFTDLAAGL
ncbi:BtrH N-terminal domain-containing protein [Halorientalis halophila]|uniref:BtrH N-terminal domain-containing protein n=1 Tax=Halorientalis halophila TaxID=3108499 RepID=UPI003009FCAA